MTLSSDPVPSALHSGSWRTCDLGGWGVGVDVLHDDLRSLSCTCRHTLTELPAGDVSSPFGTHFHFQCISTNIIVSSNDCDQSGVRTRWGESRKAYFDQKLLH